MSIKAMQAVWELSRSKGTARVILLALADHANDQMTCFPSLNTIARYANVDRRNVLRAIDKLIQLGELEVVGHGRRSVNIYRINLPAKNVSTSGEIATGGENVTSGADATSTSGEIATSTSGEIATRTIIEPSYNPHYIPPPSPPPLSADVDKSPPKAGANGQRLPDDFTLTEAMRSFAEKIGVDPQWEFESFVDYWRAVPGQRGRKKDWMATWRNWCRKSAERKPVNRTMKTFAQQDRNERMSDIEALDRITERLQNKQAQGVQHKLPIFGEER